MMWASAWLCIGPQVQWHHRMGVYVEERFRGDGRLPYNLVSQELIQSHKTCINYLQEQCSHDLISINWASSLKDFITSVPTPQKPTFQRANLWGTHSNHTQNHPLFSKFGDRLLDLVRVKEIILYPQVGLGHLWQYCLWVIYDPRDSGDVIVKHMAQLFWIFRMLNRW